MGSPQGQALVHRIDRQAEQQGDRWLNDGQSTRLLKACAPWARGAIISHGSRVLQQGLYTCWNPVIRRAFRLALKKAQVEDFRFHELRHTFATTLVQSRIDLYKVQQLLGHKSPIMTQRYAYHYPENLRNGVENLDRMRGAGTNLAQSAGQEEEAKYVTA